MKKKEVQSLLFFAASLGVLPFLYLPIYNWLMERWMNENGYFSHGPLVLLISLFLVGKTIYHYIKDARGGFGEQKASGLAIGTGVLMYLFGSFFQVYFITAASFPLFLYGVLSLYFPINVARKARFGVFFSLFAIPAPMVFLENVAIELKLLSARITTFLLNKTGVPAKTHGNLLMTPSSQLEIGAPCSGIRSIVSLLAFSVLFSYVKKRGRLHMCVLSALSFFVAMLGNVFRIYMLGLVSYIYGTETAMGTFHDVLGYVVFALDIALLLLLDAVLPGKKGEVYA